MSRIKGFFGAIAGAVTGAVTGLLRGAFEGLIGGVARLWGGLASSSSSATAEVGALLAVGTVLYYVTGAFIIGTAASALMGGVSGLVSGAVEGGTYCANAKGDSVITTYCKERASKNFDLNSWGPLTTSKQDNVSLQHPSSTVSPAATSVSTSPKEPDLAEASSNKKSASSASSPKVDTKPIVEPQAAFQAVAPAKSDQLTSLSSNPVPKSTQKVVETAKPLAIPAITEPLAPLPDKAVRANSQNKTTETPNPVASPPAADRLASSTATASNGAKAAQGATDAQRVEIQSDKIQAIKNSYLENFADNPWYKDNPPKEEGGKLNLAFKDKTDLTRFGQEQALNKRDILIVDKKTQEVMGYTKGGVLYHANGNEIKGGEKLAPSGIRREEFKVPSPKAEGPRVSKEAEQSKALETQPNSSAKNEDESEYTPSALSR